MSRNIAAAQAVDSRVTNRLNISAAQVDKYVNKEREMLTLGEFRKATEGVSDSASVRVIIARYKDDMFPFSTVGFKSKVDVASMPEEVLKHVRKVFPALPETAVVLELINVATSDGKGRRRREGYVVPFEGEEE